MYTVTRLVFRLARRRIFVAIVAMLIAVIVCGGALGAFTGTSASDSYVLTAEQPYSGHLTVVARLIDIRDGATVNGDVSIVALESATIGGHINGDLSIIASGVDVYFRPDLDVQGDLSICARSINGLDPERIHGDINKGCDQIGMALRDYNTNGRGNTGFMSNSNIASFSPVFRGYNNIWEVAVNAAILTALAGLGTALLPTHHQRLVNASIAATLPASFLGFVTLAGAVIFSVIYAVLGAVTLGILLCVGLPFMVLAWIVVNVGIVLGWIVVSFPLGAWLIRRLNLPYSRVYAAMLGAAALTVVQGVLSFIPCLNIIAALIVLAAGSWGLGTVILTRAGFRAYPEVINVKRRLDDMI
jgi:hypothetical protein